MTKTQPNPAGSKARATACLTLADGRHFLGEGFGATGQITAGLIFNTAMTGYQEVMTDPSSMGRIITFTFPYIGNAGTNPEDDESASIVPGIVTRWVPGAASNWRAQEGLVEWMQRRGVLGIGGVDTRRLTRIIRDSGIMAATLAHDPEGRFDIPKMAKAAQDWPGYPAHGPKSMTEGWTEGQWHWPHGFAASDADDSAPHVVVIDFGVKRSLLGALVDAGLRVTIMPATASAADIMDLAPDGLFLSNGPADPNRAGDAVDLVKALLDTGLPIFGAGLGHQLLALALGGKVSVLEHGNHGVNQPVRDSTTGKVAITLMNHDFTVDSGDLPAGVIPTHTNLFDGSNAGLRVEGEPIFSVQHHPQGTHDPKDDPLLFRQFADAVRAAKSAIRS